MGEVVQKRIESMIEELEDIKALNLVEEDKLKKVLAVRKDFEGKINNPNRTIQDYEVYIKHEVMLLQIIRLERDKHKVCEKKRKIEYNILRRIKNIYELALQRFSDNYSLHETFLQFCMEANFQEAGASSAQILIKHFTHKPEAWLLSSKWYSECIDEIDIAIAHVEKGLTIHPDNSDLYVQAIKLELKKCGEAASSRRKDECNRKIQSYFSLISKHILEIEVYIKILNILSVYTFTGSSYKSLRDYLFTHHFYKETVWDFFAKEDLKSKGSSSDDSTISYVDPVLTCISKYKRGLQLMPNDKKKDLCDLYLRQLINFKNESRSVGSVHSSDFLLKEIEKAHNENYLSEKYYVVWLDLTGDENIISRALESHPTSLEIRKLDLKLAILKKDENKVEEAFLNGMKALTSESLPLWLMIIQFYFLSTNSNRVSKLKALFEDGVTQNEQISKVLKPKYIDWIGNEFGIIEARNKYLELAERHPYCKELHDAMSRMEFDQVNRKSEAWEKVHRLACGQFGDSDIEVWVNYVEFFILTKRGDDDLNEKLSELFVEAKRRLPEFFHETFIQKYNTKISEL